MLHWIPLTFSKVFINHMLFCQSTVKRLTVRYMPQYKIQTTCLPITFTDNVLYLSLKLRSHRMRRRRRRAAYGIFAATWRKRCDTKHSDKFHYLIMFVSLTNKGKRNSLLQPVLVVKFCCKTSSSAAAERPREPLSQLKSCQLLHNCTKNHI